MKLTTNQLDKINRYTKVLGSFTIEDFLKWFRPSTKKDMNIETLCAHALMDYCCKDNKAAGQKLTEIQATVGITQQDIDLGFDLLYTVGWLDLQSSGFVGNVADQPETKYFQMLEYPVKDTALGLVDLDSKNKLFVLSSFEEMIYLYPSDREE